MALVSLAACFFLTTDTISQPEQAARARRAEVRSVVATLSTRWSFLPDGEIAWTSRIWIDGDKVREDRSRAAGPDATREVLYKSPEEVVFWSSDTLGGGGGVAINRWRGLQMKGLSQAFLPLDLRLLALQVEDTINLRTYTWDTLLVGSLDRAKTQVSGTQWKGHDASETTFEKANKVKCRIIVVPDVGDAVVFGEVADSKGNREYFECEHGKDRTAGIWFPTKYLFEALGNGKVTRREETEVHLDTINTPIDPKIFTLAGMDLPDGKLIATVPQDPRGDTYWVGQREVLGKPLVPLESRASRWFYRVAAGLCVLVAVVALWKYLSARRAMAQFQ